MGDHLSSSVTTLQAPFRRLSYCRTRYKFGEVYETGHALKSRNPLHKRFTDDAQHCCFPRSTVQSSVIPF